MALVQAADVSELLRDVMIRFLESQRRQAGSEMSGKVTDVDTTKHLARIEIGKDDDGNQVKSPWVPYAQIAGDLKFHQPPVKDQLMTLRSENGDVEQGTLHPSGFTDANPSPSTDAATNVMTFGSVKVTIAKDHLLLEVGGTSWRFSADGKDQTGGYSKHDGHSVDKTHKHSGVVHGGELTDPPAN
jgi:hypothetical protein